MTDTHRRVRFATWNMDHWKRPVNARRHAWGYLEHTLGADVALLQECVVPRDLARSRAMYREIGGSRPWGSAVVAFDEALSVEEVGPVRTRHASTRFHLLGTYPGTVVVAEISIPRIGSVTCVSVYGLIEVYAQTTMLRIVADLIPLFDSPQGERVVLGGDFNITTATHPATRDLKRYDAILKTVEALGLQNLAETAAERPQFADCPCGAESCHHLHTFGKQPGNQLAWLFATPELAARCARLSVDRDGSQELSDHAPILADLDIPVGDPQRQWDPESFLEEFAARNGAVAGRVGEEILAWAERKHESLKRRGHSFARLDRLPTSTGPDPELWVQLDLRDPEELAYTISLTMRGDIVVQFQHMRRPPFDTEQGKRELWSRIDSLPGVQLDDRLNGRPSFAASALAADRNLPRFLDILECLVDDVVQAHQPESALGQPAPRGRV